MQNKKIKINTLFIKLDSFLKFSGITPTGGQAKELIQNGKVFVENEICTQRGKKLYTGTKIKINNELFEVVRE